MDGARLILKQSDGERREIALAPRTTLGRQPQNAIQVHDREVSKEHAIVEQTALGWRLRDLGSSNGTFMRGERVTEVELTDGDEFAIGGTTFTFRGGPMTLTASRMHGRGVTVVHSRAEVEAVLAAYRSDRDATFAPEAEIRSEPALRRDYEKLRLAAELSQQIGAERDEQALLDRIVEFALKVFPADNGVILLVDPRSGLLEPRTVQRREQASADVVVSESVLARVRESREAVLIADAGSDQRFSSSQSIVSQGIRSCMAVPLVVSDQVRGVLFLDSRVRTQAFAEKDLALLSGIASQASLALERGELHRRVEAEAVTRAHLARFLSPALVEQAQAGKIELGKGGKESPVTVLFSDIRGFTTFSERVGPQETVELLNEYFERMVDCVFRHGGVLDKFIGDALMAIWGAPVQRPDDAERALQAALEMQSVLAEFNAERVAAGRPAVAIGIGVNAGPAVVGNMGSSKRLEYTVIGDTVNVASRLCSIAAAGEIVASAETVAQAGGRFEVEPMPPAKVKGKTATVELFRVLGVDVTLLR